jgi:membrane-bound lytic murein transglycosylase B
LSFIGWIWVAASAASIGSSAAPVTSQPIQLAQASVPLSATAQSSSYSWETYKVRLASLARLQGVRESTIQGYVPGLDINSRVIELERTEPVAHSSNGVVGVLAPYLRVHVTRSLIARGQANYFDHYSGLQRLEARYGVDPAVLMAPEAPIFSGHWQALDITAAGVTCSRTSS